MTRPSVKSSVEVGGSAGGRSSPNVLIKIYFLIDTHFKIRGKKM